MARYECGRCGVECFTTNPPHLCRDLRLRHERQARAVDLVNTVLVEHGCESGTDVALAIVRALSGRDLGVD